MTYRIAYCGWQAIAIWKPQVMMDFGNVFFRRCLALRKRARLWVYVCKKWCLCCRITLLATQALLDLKVYACSCFSFPKQTHTHTQKRSVFTRNTRNSLILVGSVACSMWLVLLLLLLLLTSLLFGSWCWWCRGFRENILYCMNPLIQKFCSSNENASLATVHLFIESIVVRHEVLAYIHGFGCCFDDKLPLNRKICIPLRARVLLS